jgi:hypothetical protein
LNTVDNNPTWKAGVPVVKQGVSNGVDTFSGGWLRLIGEGTNSPYYSVFNRTGIAYNNYTEVARLGNLNGYLGYATDLYGIGIGDSTHYLKYDPTNHLRIAGSITASTIDIGTNGFHCDVNGNIWWGASATYASATIKISAAGGIVGSTINIPDVTTPLFKVDSSGNCKVKSLQRDDLHLFTFFESLDGYVITTSGTSSVTLVGYPKLWTGTTINSKVSIAKYNNSNDLEWGKQFNLKYSVSFLVEAAKDVWLVKGSLSSAIVQKVGFHVNNANIYGYTADGTNYTETFLATYSSAAAVLEVKFIPGVSATFYINGAETETITTTIPTGTTAANLFFNISLENTEAAEKTMTLEYYDYWQKTQ